MQVIETQIDELTRQFRIAVPAADIERKVETKLNELAHSVRLPGFRPGKVPVALLRKRYGASVKSEVIGEAIDETSQAVISDRGIRVAMPPRVELAESPEQGDILEYTMAIEVLPEVTPPDYAEIRLERLVAEVDDAEIERRLRRFAEAVGEETPIGEARPVAEDDIVVIDILGPEDKWPFDNERSLGVRVRAGRDGTLLGSANGCWVCHPAPAPPSPSPCPTTSSAGIPGGNGEDFRNRRQGVAQAPAGASVDDELARKGGWESLDEMRSWLRQQHETELKSHTRLRLKRALLDRLAELYAFTVPKGLLEREYEALARQLREAESSSGGAAEESRAATGSEHVHDEHCGHDPEHHHEPAPAASNPALPEDKQREYRALAERRVRLGLVLAEIGRVNNLRVTPEELGKALIAQARRFQGQEQAMLEFLRKNPQAQELVAAPILEDKVIDFILEMAQVSERTVSAGELLRDDDAETTSSPDEARVPS